MWFCPICCVMFIITVTHSTHTIYDLITYLHLIYLFFLWVWKLNKYSFDNYWNIENCYKVEWEIRLARIPLCAFVYFSWGVILRGWGVNLWGIWALERDYSKGKVEIRHSGYRIQKRVFIWEIFLKNSVSFYKSN